MNEENAVNTSRQALGDITNTSSVSNLTPLRKKGTKRTAPSPRQNLDFASLTNEIYKRRNMRTGDIQCIEEAFSISIQESLWQEAIAGVSDNELMQNYTKDLEATIAFANLERRVGA